MDKLLTFIAGPWGALIGKVMMGMTLAAMIYVAIANYNDGIRETQQLKDSNAQLEQVVKDNNEFRIKLKGLEEANKQILLKLEKKNDKVIEKHTDVTRYIVSPEGQKTDRESSEVLKETVRMLRDEK